MKVEDSAQALVDVLHEVFGESADQLIEAVLVEGDQCGHVDHRIANRW